ncbi:MAG TPA: 50S ribosomal protein L25/general stress protein Ctc [Gemmatimonadaceae bacterium]|nr:50S ribosomal protein L25/general stress protein Ctc [Gemmatimonadaceae bacterium]
MATVSLSAQVRTETGTGVARKLRVAGQVPAVIYGHGRAPQSLAINTREIEKLLSTVSAGSTVIELGVDGRTARTLIREIQRHPTKRSIVHVDFQELVAGEKITVSIPLRFTGTADGVRNLGGILEEVMHQVHLRLDPASIPDHVDVDVTPLTIGHSIHIRELKLPEGVTVLDDPGATVCVCTAPKAEVAAVAAEGVEGAAVPEPELIRKPKAEGEEEAK